MTAWASMLIPAGSVVVGAVIAGGAAFGGQVLTHRGSFQREREARRDSFKVARFETERETLLSLQEVILEQVTLIAEFLSTSFGRDGDEARALLLESTFKITTLTSRCLSREAAKAVQELSSQVTQVLLLKESSVGYGPAFNRAQEALGAALRQDPFEDTP